MSEIIIERGALGRAGEISGNLLGGGTAAIIADDTVDALYGGALGRAGEISANLPGWAWRKEETDGR